MNKKLQSDILLLITAVIWGSAFVAQKAGAVLEPFTYNGIRMLIGGLVSMPFTQVWNFAGVIDWGSLAGYLVVTVVGTVLSFALYLNSSKYLSAMEMTIIASIEPLASVVLEMICFGQMFNLIGLSGFLFILVAVLAVSRH